MQELLEQLDPDHYREARLDVLRAAIEQLRRGREALAEVERRSQIPLGTSRSVIAVVDDEESIRKAVVRLLQAAGYTARGFASGNDLLQNWPENRPDCLLLDLQMFPLSGTEVQRALNHSGALFPVIIITAQDAPGVREQCLRQGAVAYLSKPLDGGVLLNALKLALDVRSPPFGGVSDRTHV